MPRVMIEADGKWWENWQAVIDTAMDTCEGLKTRIDQHVQNSTTEPPRLLYELASQLDNLKGQLRSIRLPF